MSDIIVPLGGTSGKLHAVINADIASQIVNMVCEEDMRELANKACIVSMERRLAQLELISKTANESLRLHDVAGYRQRLDALESDMAKVKATADPPATDGAGDEAAVEALDRVLEAQSDAACNTKRSRAILAAIRRGEVPGVWYNQQIATERDALRAKVVSLTRDRDNISINNDLLICRAKEMEAERVAAMARVAELEAKLADAQRVVALAEDNRHAIKAERDRALAELAKEKAERDADIKTCNETLARMRSALNEAQARKVVVTLPVNGILRHCGGTFYLEELVIKSIRAAGGEVAQLAGPSPTSPLSADKEHK